MSNLHRLATEYSELGWCTLPVPHGEKSPRFKWGAYQNQMPTSDDLNRWFAKDDCGIAVVCGAVSENLAVLDFDEPGSYEFWQSENSDLASQLPTDKRGDRYHVFARLHEPVRSQDLFIPGFGRAGELLCEGKLAVLPPTVHASGESRTWQIPPLGHIPKASLEELGIVTVQQKPETTSEPLRLIDKPIPEGQRHKTLLKLSGKLRAQGHGFGMIFDLLLAVNSFRCKPELDQEEIRKIADWASRQDANHPLREPIWDDETNQTPTIQPSVITTYSLGDDDESERYGHLFKSCPDYLEEVGPEEFAFVVSDFLPETYLVVLGGNSKAGKSCLVTALSMAVAEGEPFLGFQTKQGAVLWCAYEESEQERAIALREFDKMPSNLYLTHHKVHIDKAEGIAALRYWIRRTGAKLLVIDPLYGASTAESLADGRTARQTLAGLKELCREEKVCAIVLHHFNKAVGNGLTRERFADSNQILATASMDLLMDATEHGDGTREIRLQGRGRGSFANNTWQIRSRGVADFELQSVGKGNQADAELKVSEIQRVLGESAEPMTAEAISKATNQKLSSVRNRLTKLVKSELVEPYGTFGKATLYRVAGGALRAEVA